MPFPFLPSRSADGLGMLSEERLSSEADQSARITEAIAALAAMPVRVRRRAVASLDHAALAKFLRAAAAPLFRSLIEDSSLQQSLRNDVALAWLSVDPQACAAHVLATFRDWEPGMLLRILSAINAEEAFEVLAPIFEGDTELRKRFAIRGRDPSCVYADERWIDLALRMLSTDASAACHVLFMNGSERAAEELAGIVDRAANIDDGLLAAIEILEESLLFRGRASSTTLVRAVASFLTKPAAEGVERSRVAVSVSNVADLLLKEATVRNSKLARTRIAACRVKF